MTPTSFAIPDLMPAAPEIFLLAAGCVVLMVDVVLSDRSRWVTMTAKGSATRGKHGYAGPVL